MSAILLAQQGIQAIAVDIPGYGMSDTPDHPPSIAEYAQMVPAILDHLGLQTERRSAATELVRLVRYAALLGPSSREWGLS